MIKKLLIVSMILSMLVSCSKETAKTETDKVTAVETTVITETTAPEPECEHMWGMWILTKGPTVKKTGEEMHTCSYCNKREYKQVAKLSGENYKVCLDVDNILQNPSMPNACEIVSLTTALRYMGYDITQFDIADYYINRGFYGEDNPFYTFLGDPRGLAVGCYAPCIVNAANSYLSEIGASYEAIDISNSTFKEYREHIDNNRPVIFWGTMYMNCDPSIFSTMKFDGKEVIWRNHSHCLVMVGYTADKYIFCDPLVEGKTEYYIADVEESHSLVYSQACVIVEK